MQTEKPTDHLVPDNVNTIFFLLPHSMMTQLDHPCKIPTVEQPNRGGRIAVDYIYIYIYIYAFLRKICREQGVIFNISHDSDFLCIIP
ncbi:hypothetical protein CKAN_01065800 [Cinnamomum micranthum f. kanehirae]|uniref:Uncharacterized protein n=1 Tax=Cinnamomum micranthum f. kanehirae TaxID=337451 RepID=A0A443NTX2_9MAGN|nr:hypothetical protein CKAN_01065800 [Cinnamomum micranthum f. kanehirae]